MSRILGMWNGLRRHARHYLETYRSLSCTRVQITRFVSFMHIHHLHHITKQRLFIPSCFFTLAISFQFRSAHMPHSSHLSCIFHCVCSLMRTKRWSVEECCAYTDSMLTCCCCMRTTVYLPDTHAHIYTRTHIPIVSLFFAREFIIQYSFAAVDTSRIFLLVVISMRRCHCSQIVLFVVIRFVYIVVYNSVCCLTEWLFDLLFWCFLFW